MASLKYVTAQFNLLDRLAVSASISCAAACGHGPGVMGSLLPVTLIVTGDSDVGISVHWPDNAYIS